VFVIQPLTDLHPEQFRLVDTFSHRVIGNQIARIIGRIALFTEGIKHNHVFRIQPYRFGKCLDHSLMMSGLAAKCSVTVSLQCRIGHLHDGFVGGVKAIFVANHLYLCIRDITLSYLEQALDGERVGFDAL